MKYTKKPRYKLHAVIWTPIKKKKFEVEYKQEIKPFYSQHQYGLGFTYNGGVSRKCRYRLSA